MRGRGGVLFSISPATVAVLIYQRIVGGLIIRLVVPKCDNSKRIRHNFRQLNRTQH